MTRALLAALLLCGCASAPPGAARIAAFSANAQFCGHAGTPICEARVHGVDGAAALSGAIAYVEPGRRRLRIFCRLNLSIMIGDAQTFEREIVAELAPGGRYRLEARMTPEPCSVALVEDR
jgi:hypothetical protein